MSKPILEREWRWDDGAGPGVREGRRRVLRGEPTTTAEDIALAVAAPDMARALLHRQRCEVYGYCSRCEEETTAALRKAKVIP